MTKFLSLADLAPILLFMKRVKVSFGKQCQTNILLRHSPNFSGRWNNSQFFINQNVQECDYWVALHSSGIVVKETSVCPISGLVYASMEPSETVCSVPNSFLSQFSSIVSVDQALATPNVIQKNLHTWWAGMTVKHVANRHSFSDKSLWSYNDFVLTDFVNSNPVHKKDRISIVVSSKQSLPGHFKRLEFLNKIQNSVLGPFIDVYGGGFNPIDDKLDAISSYKYHLVLENSLISDYWSEKLADSFLGTAFPFYSGCTNIFQYFPRDSLMPIDLSNPNAAIDMMYSAIKSSLFDRSVHALLNARNLILNKYNIFSELDSILSGIALENPTTNTLRPCYYYRDSLPRRLIKKFIYRL